MSSRSFVWSRLVLLLLLGSLLGCDLAVTDQPLFTPDVLQNGASWTYDITFTRSPVDAERVDTLEHFTARMWVADTSARIGPLTNLIEVHVFPASAPDRTDQVWYQQSPDSLVEVAYSTPIDTDLLPLAAPSPTAATQKRRRARTRRLLRGLTATPRLAQPRTSAPKTHEGAIQVRPDSRIALQAPLREDATWISFRSPFVNRRTVRADTTITTPAGTFETLKIQTTLPNRAPSLDWRDYYAARGLVRRRIVDTRTLRDDRGNIIGDFTFREHYELVDDHR